MTSARTVKVMAAAALSACLFLVLSVLPALAQTSAYDYDPNDPTACWADPFPSDAPNYRVDCNDPACDIGPCAIQECWYDPSRDDPARLAPSFTVSCADPRCNVGPCISSGSGVSGSAGAGVTNTTEPPPTSPETPGSSSAGAPASADSVGTLPAEPQEVPAQTPEWTNLNESDPGLTEGEQRTADGSVSQRNESDMEFVRERAADSKPNIVLRIWHFLTGWWR